MILPRTYIDAIRRLLRQTAVAVVPLMALLLMGACRSDVAGDEPGDVQREPVYRAGFYVTTGDVRLSRAPAPGDYEAGTPVENYIDIDGGDFRILMFNENDTYVGQLTDILIHPASSDGTFKTYLVSGIIPAAVPETLGGKLKVMMLANWRGSYPEPEAGVTSLADIATDAASLYDFSYPADTQIGAGRLIPMFGVTDLLTGLEFDPGWSIDLGTIHMLRAYAQVRVRVAEGSLPIVSARLTNANSRGYRAPIGVKAQADYVSGSYAHDYYRLPSIPADARVRKGMAFTMGTDGCWRIYVPEFANLADPSKPQQPKDDADRCQLEVKFEGDVLTHYIDFKYYDDPPSYAHPDARKGDHFNILRNNIYDYTLRRMTGESEVQVEVDVIPYSEVVLKPEFGLDRDNVTGWIIIKGYAPKTYYYDDKHDRYYDGDKNPIAKRVELSENGLYLIRDPRTRELRYAYDYAADKYWLDRDRLKPFTEVMQYEKYLPEATITTGLGETGKLDVLVMWQDEYGSAISMYGIKTGIVYDKNLAPRDYIPNYGYKRWTEVGYESRGYMVIAYDYDGNPMFFYDVANDKYFYDGKPGEISLREVEAFPPRP